MLYDHFLTLSLRLSHLVNEFLNRGLDLPQPFLCRRELAFKGLDAFLQAVDLVLQLILDGFLAIQGSLVSLLKFGDSVSMVLLFLGKLSVEVLIQLGDQSLVLLLQLLDLLSMQ